MKHLYQSTLFLGLQLIFRPFIISCFLCLAFITASAQCPQNIDFEMGDFTGWKCWSGSYVSGVLTVNQTPPTPGRHDIVSAAYTPALDPYGSFPTLCPNGSNYSIRIGIQSGGHTADGVSYTFTIPPGQNKFNLIYNYAIVINNGGGHSAIDQPRLMVTVKNLTDGTTNTCSSFDIAYSNSNPLPGFQPEGAATFKWKPWAANSINLDGNAGKTIELTFMATGCGLATGTHFGYAYVDVNSQCSSAFSGATFCPDDTSVTVTAPFGYQAYQWYSLTNPNLGQTQTITLNPPPLSGDSIFVDMTPFNGYGCPTTLKAYLYDTLTVHSIAGPDKNICYGNSVQLGVPPEPGRVYKWTPVTGLSDPNISNPIATPAVSTTYTLTVTNSGGGCSTPDAVDVKVANLSDQLTLDGVDSYCIGSGQHATLILNPVDADSIQWYQDGNPIPGALGHQPQITVTQTGAYYATLFSYSGCDKSTIVKQINIYETPVAGFAVNTVSQCQTGNQFVFTNSSTLTTGALQYSWDLGDNTTETTRDVTHVYTAPGNYTVKLLVTAPGGCTDSRTLEVVVKPSANSSFSVNSNAACFKDNRFVFTNNSTTTGGTLQYSWDMGNTVTFNTKDVTYSYPVPGTYTVKLTATAEGGCQDDSTFNVTVESSPVAAFAVNNAAQCLPVQQFVLTNGSTIYSGNMQYAWDMGDGTAIQTTPDVNYAYANAGQYTVKLLTYTTFGCKDSISKTLTVHPVPLADFTIRPVCENLPVPVINRTYNNTTSTINYLWDFGDGHTDNVKTPVYSYPSGGTYPVKLSVNTVQCPATYDTKTIMVTIDIPARGITYPDKDAAFNFPEPLQARQFGTSVTWTPPTSLSNRFSYTPVFTGIDPQLYTIEIKTATGCLTVDTQMVKTHKKIEIYVPTGFTPNDDGNNDRLRPVLIGFSKVNYFRIYNRWGQLLFTMNSDQPGWDGKINNKPAETQTVVWMIEAVDVDGKVHNKQGTTVLFR
ncbi:PKD domain-containing protein [Ferruginibacter sp.]